MTASPAVIIGRVRQRPIGERGDYDRYWNMDALDAYQTSAASPRVNERDAERIIRLGITRDDCRALDLYLRIGQRPDEYRHVTRSVPKHPLVGTALIEWVAAQMNWMPGRVAQCLEVITYMTE